MDEATTRITGNTADSPALPAHSLRALEQQTERSDDPATIKARIEETRAHLSETVNKIQERLSPEHLKEQAQEVLREATIGKVEEMAYMAKRKANRGMASLIDTIKANPLPAAVAGLGLAWLFASGSNERESHGYDYEYDNYEYGADAYGRYRRSRPSQTSRFAHAAEFAEEAGEAIRDRYYETVRDAREAVQETRDHVEEWVDEKQAQASEIAHQVRERAEDWQQNVGQTAEEWRDSARETAEEWRDSAEEYLTDAQTQAKYYTRQAKRQVQHTWQENPLAIGITAAAAGAIFGMMLPTTEAENRLLGETRNRLLAQAQEVAVDTLDKVQNVAQEAAATAKDKVEALAGEAQDAAKSVKNTAMQEAQRQQLGNPTSSPTRKDN